MSNPIANRSNWSSPPSSSPDPGVNMVVGGGTPLNRFIQVAQMDSMRKDLFYGSYRALMKINPVPGTCTAFFWVRLLLFHLVLVPD